MELKQLGGWNSDKVAQGYVDHSTFQMEKTSNAINSALSLENCQVENVLNIPCKEQLHFPKACPQENQANAPEKTNNNPSNTTPTNNNPSNTTPTREAEDTVLVFHDDFDNFDECEQHLTQIEKQFSTGPPQVHIFNDNFDCDLDELNEHMSQIEEIWLSQSNTSMNTMNNSMEKNDPVVSAICQNTGVQAKMKNVQGFGRSDSKPGFSFSNCSHITINFK